MTINPHDTPGDPDQEAEIELMRRELKEAQETNRYWIQKLASKGYAFNVSGLKMEAILEQLFPDVIDRLKFELYFAGKLALQIREAKEDSDLAKLWKPGDKRTVIGGEGTIGATTDDN